MIWSLIIRILVALDDLLERLDYSVTRGVGRVWGARGKTSAHAE